MAKRSHSRKAAQELGNHEIRRDHPPPAVPEDTQDQKPHAKHPDCARRRKTQTPGVKQKGKKSNIHPTS
ncbi:hypothetical protein FKM82_020597 [Ascaphus truei]